MGIGARVFHEACEDGWESVKDIEFAMSRRVVEEIMVSFVEMMCWNKLKYIYLTRSNQVVQRILPAVLLIFRTISQDLRFNVRNRLSRSRRCGREFGDIEGSPKMDLRLAIFSRYSNDCAQDWRKY